MIRSVILVAALMSAAHAQVAPGEKQTPASDPEPTKAEPSPEKPDPGPAAPPTEPPSTDVPPIAAPEVAPKPIAPDPVPRPLQAEPATADDDVTSAKRLPSERFDLHWKLMMIPASLIELAFVPVGLFVSAVDQYALGQRFFDALDVFHDFVSLSPRFKFSFSDGPGIGLWIAGAPLFDNRAVARLGGLVRLNGDWQAELEYKHALLLPGGRALRLRSFISHDKNRRYYGLGGNSTTDDERVISDNQVGAYGEVDLQGISRYRWSGVAGLGVRNQKLGNGTDSTIPTLTADGPVLVPLGFNESATFVDATLTGRYDTRDSLGRPTRGVLLVANGLGRTDVTGKHLSAVTLSGSATWHIPVLQDHRVLLFTASGAAAYPLFKGDDIPLDSLAVIGRSNVRGYDRDRFRDRYALVGTVEYRFPVYQYLATRAGLDAAVFFDSGTVWGRTPFREGTFDYSVGAGLRAATENALFVEADLAMSPDGFQFNFGLETLL